MLDHFNIQVDNPVSILTQDTSKHFLHSKSGQDKYTVRTFRILQQLLIDVILPFVLFLHV